LGEILRGQLGGVLPGLHYFIYGIVVIAVILITPQGLLPLFERLWKRRPDAVVAAKPPTRAAS
jgi:branched-chain amino acid transport system permease protein